MVQSGRTLRLPLWTALAPVFTSIAAAGSLGDDNNLFPTWAEVLLLIASVGLVLFILGLTAWQRWGPDRS